MISVRLPDTFRKAGIWVRIYYDNIPPQFRIQGRYHIFKARVWTVWEIQIHHTSIQLCSAKTCFYLFCKKLQNKIKNLLAFTTSSISFAGRFFSWFKLTSLSCPPGLSSAIFVESLTNLELSSCTLGLTNRCITGLTFFIWGLTRPWVCWPGLTIFGCELTALFGICGLTSLPAGPGLTNLWTPGLTSLFCKAGLTFWNDDGGLPWKIVYFTYCAANAKIVHKLTLVGAPGLTRGVRFLTCMGGLTAFGVLARPVVPPWAEGGLIWPFASGTVVGSTLLRHFFNNSLARRRKSWLVVFRLSSLMYLPNRVV